MPSTTKDSAKILDIVKSMTFTDDTTIGFSIPFANGIVLMSCGYASLAGKVLYYGDEMSFSIWRMLHVPIGTRTDTDPILTLQTGYKYIYYYSRNKFTVYDASGAEVLTRNNITSMADLHIDFTIHKSHQFEVKIDQDDATMAPYLIPAIANKKLYGDSPIFGITDGVAGDTSEIYRGENIPNYVMFESGGIFSPVENYKKYFRKRVNVVTRLNPIVGACANITYNHVKNTNSVYSIDGFNGYSDLSDVFGGDGGVEDNPKVINPSVVLRTYKLKLLLLSMLCPKVSDSIVPMYQKVVRPGEANNNRPVYEPWLIWGVLKFIWLKRSSNDDDMEIDVFDLSPTWAN